MPKRITDYLLSLVDNHIHTVNNIPIVDIEKIKQILPTIQLLTIRVGKEWCDKSLRVYIGVYIVDCVTGGFFGWLIINMYYFLLSTNLFYNHGQGPSSGIVVYTAWTLLRTHFKRLWWYQIQSKRSALCMIIQWWYLQLFLNILD